MLGRAGLALFLILASSSAGAQPALDRSTWGEMLKAHTRHVGDMAGTRVDYRGLAADARWRRLVRGLAETAVPERPDDAKAFWIDVYNMLAIDWLVRHPEAESIRDLGSFLSPVWKKPAGIVAGQQRSLHEIEHEILRPMGDARIHMAIVCASTSCPSLAREPFASVDLNSRLDAAVGRFLDDPRKGLRVDRIAGVVHVSKIFEWFEGDFASHGGILGFIRQHLDDAHEMAPADAAWLRMTGGQARIEALAYDWRVNAVPH